MTRILATFDPLFDLDSVVINGRYVFAHELQVALFQTGAVDRLVVFGDVDENRLAAVSGGLGPYLPQIDLHETVDAPWVLNETPVLAIHTSLDKALLGPLAEVRTLLEDADVPLTATVHGVGYARQHPQLLQTLLADIGDSDAIICPSPSVRRSLNVIFSGMARRAAAKTGGHPPTLPRLQVVPHGVDAELFKPRPRAAIRAELGMDPERPLLLMCGRLSPANKLDMLPILAALAPLWHERREPAPLLVHIVPTESRYLLALTNQAKAFGIDIKWVFDPPRERLARYYNAADVFLGLSDTIAEMFGLSLVEAMASATPIVASEVGGYRDLIDHDVTGLVVPTYFSDCVSSASRLALLRDDQRALLGINGATAIDHQALLASTRALLDAPDRAARLGEAARAAVEQQYAWSVVAPGYVALWQELRATHAAGGPRQPLSVAYFEAFGPNLGQALGPETRFVRTLDPAGFEADWWPLVHAHIKQKVSRQLVSWLLDREGAWSVSERAADADAVGPVTAERLMFATMWALKQSLVRLAG